MVTSFQTLLSHEYEESSTRIDVNTCLMNTTKQKQKFSAKHKQKK